LGTLSCIHFEREREREERDEREREREEREEEERGGKRRRREEEKEGYLGCLNLGSSNFPLVNSSWSILNPAICHDFCVGNSYVQERERREKEGRGEGGKRRKRVV
jgi:hypothetical protein